MPSALEVISNKRDGQPLNAAEVAAFVHGLTHNTWSDSQAAALAMAILLRHDSDRDHAVNPRDDTQW